MRKLASDVWDEIARQYRAGTPVNVVAKRFKVSRVNIERRAIQFGWVRDPVDDGDAGAAGPRPEEGAGSLQGAQQAAAAHGLDPRAVLMERHKAAWKDVYLLGEDADRVLKGQKPKLLKDIEADNVKDRLSLALALSTMFEKRAKALLTAQEGERRAYGIDYKQQQASQAEDEATARRRVELVTSIVDEMRTLKHREERVDAFERRYGTEWSDSDMTLSDV